MDQSDATMNELNGEFSITRSYNSKGTDQHSIDVYKRQGIEGADNFGNTIEKIAL